MDDRNGIFAGDDPIALVRAWLAEAERTEPADANAISLATVDADGMPNVRVVLLKEIEADVFVFYTNYEGAKGRELTAQPKAAFLLYWKSLGRQIRVRGPVERIEAAQSDAYYATRDLASRHGAWASRQSQPLESRAALEAEVARVAAEKGPDPERPPHWGGFRIRPVEIEFWANGAARLHDRFLWSRNPEAGWDIRRLNP
ncbi:pyridoxamine 5'-phosphate oxidase [Jannaschia aquimarina]|uniref:Pyridoxine/pyridoxamine 5'-phosphate oxidase n=1 Tax=Jannaschia aquimarina TaxID=935700 RepID=A0A0D1D768_9RHOB|nr:pyridoxamine 5'-phosphate oxidase [Jannaschia aquimarina]KIT15783.1 Pyridoxine/pyridoxamine 5'-phosphate oxidase [Jannaschia aquimarina]SNT21003.1 Pyridoxamine 5'-phosphate oxidase [Jannaschia aquimarina]